MKLADPTERSKFYPILHNLAIPTLHLRLSEPFRFQARDQAPNPHIYGDRVGIFGGMRGHIVTLTDALSSLPNCTTCV
jgi:hypothetical protein